MIIFLSRDMSLDENSEYIYFKNMTGWIRSTADPGHFILLSGLFDYNLNSKGMREIAAVNFDAIIGGQGVPINLIQTQIPSAWLKAIPKIGSNMHNTLRGCKFFWEIGLIVFKKQPLKSDIFELDTIEHEVDRN